MVKKTNVTSQSLKDELEKYENTMSSYANISHQRMLQIAIMLCEKIEQLEEKCDECYKVKEN